MSLLPSLNPRKGADEPASEPDSRGADDSRASNESVFDLIPPQPKELDSPTADDEEEERPYKPSLAVAGRNVHSIGITDLSRLAIDNDGRLYWDGKPVEVRRRIMMSRAQIAATTIIGAFVVIGAIGAAIHGSAAALDFACRLGWTASYCGAPDPGPPPRPDIPA